MCQQWVLHHSLCVLCVEREGKKRSRNARKLPEQSHGMGLWIWPLSLEQGREIFLCPQFCSEVAFLI